MKKPPAKVQPLLVGVAIGLLVGVLVLDLVLPTGVVHGVFYVGLVMLSLASGRPLLTFLAAFAFTGLLLYDHLSLYPPPAEIPWPVQSRIGLILVGIWVPFFASLATKQAAEHEQLMSTPLHLCPSCKKLRNDKGVWNKLDEYFRTELEREVAPGMCPGCRAKWTAGQASYHQA